MQIKFHEHVKRALDKVVADELEYYDYETTVEYEVQAAVIRWLNKQHDEQLDDSHIVLIQ